MLQYKHMNYRVGNVFRCARRKLDSFLRGDTLIEVMFAIGIFSLVAITVVSVMTSGSSNMQTSLETTMARNEIDAQAEALRFIHQAYLAEKEEDLPESEKYYAHIWEEITTKARENAIDLHDNSMDRSFLNYSPSTCNELYSGSGSIANQRAFILDTQAIGTEGIVVRTADNATVGDVFKEASVFPRVVYSGSDDSLVSLGGAFSGVEGLYIFPVQDWGNTVLSVDGGGSNTARTGTDSAFFDFYIRSCWYGSGKTIPTTISTLIRLYDPDVNVSSSTDAMDFVLTYDWNEIKCSNGGAEVNCPAVQQKIRVTDASHTFAVMSLSDLIAQLPDGLSPISSPLGWTRNESGLCVNSSSDYSLVNAVTVYRNEPMVTIKAVTRCEYQMSFTTAACGASSPWTPAQKTEWCPKTSVGSASGQNMTLPPSTMNLSGTNQRFDGWRCKENNTSKCEGDTSTHAPGSTVHYGVRDNGKPILYKLFEPVYTNLYYFELKFDKNSGTDAVSGMPSTQSYGWYADTSHTFSFSKPTREGYIFKGWSKSSTSTSIVAQTSYQMSYSSGSRSVKQTLYAVWEEDTTPSVICWKIVGSWNSGDIDTFLNNPVRNMTYSDMHYTDTNGYLWYANGDQTSGGSESKEFPVYADMDYKYTAYRYRTSASTSIGVSVYKSPACNRVYTQVGDTHYYDISSYVSESGGGDGSKRHILTIRNDSVTWK